MTLGPEPVYLLLGMSLVLLKRLLSFKVVAECLRQDVFFPRDMKTIFLLKMRCFPERNIDVALVAMPGNAQNANVKSWAC